MAHPDRDGGVKTRRYELAAYIGNGGDVRVRERHIGELLPPFCPERHINDGGTFCIGLRAGYSVNTENAACSWWMKLQAFLCCQETAASTRAWPKWAQLSHGDAGDIQLSAEFVADRIGMRAEYDAAVQYNLGHVAKNVANFDTARNVLRKARPDCICSPAQAFTCENRKYDCLIALETMRKRAEVDFWTTLDASRCCKTMNGCPLLAGKRTSDKQN